MTPDTKHKANWSSPSRAGQLACVALAGAAFVLAFTETTFRATIWVGVACAFAVFSRVCQAEAHHTER